MKSYITILGVFIVLGSIGLTSALAADVVQMATSEDLSAFDAQLNVDDAAPMKVKKNLKARTGNGLGAAVSAAAKSIKESGLKGSFGQTVRMQAIGHGHGAAGNSNSVMGAGRSENRNRDQAAVAAGAKKDKK